MGFVLAFWHGEKLFNTKLLRWKIENYKVSFFPFDPVDCHSFILPIYIKLLQYCTIDIVDCECFQTLSPNFKF